MPTFAQTLMQAADPLEASCSGSARSPSSSCSSSCCGSRPRRRTRCSSPALDPAETGKVTAALDEQGIAYELRANGTSVAVEKAQVSQARIALAGAGVAASGGSQEGFELFDKQKLGASDFQQKVTYQRALEGEIASTVEQVDGVTGAQVQLVLPEDVAVRRRGDARDRGGHARPAPPTRSSPAPCAASRSSCPRRSRA